MDRNSLHSCFLVNKEWCNFIIPILWKIHAWNLLNLRTIKNSIKISKKKLYNTIFSSLSPSSKQLLSDNNIKLPSTILLKLTLFNYISFCEFPDAGLLMK